VTWQQVRARLGAVLTCLRALLRHPLAIPIIVGLVAALLVPQFTRQWTDRQKEQDIKQKLLDQMSTSSTTAVEQAIALRNGQVRAAGGQPGESPGAIYAVLRNSWQIERAGARSTIITYFPGLYTCWYSYERALADFLGLGDLNPGARSARIGSLRTYVGADFAESYVAPFGPDGCVALDALPESVRLRYEVLKGLMAGRRGWDGLALATTTPRFRNTYAVLGELLLIGNERIVLSVVRAKARNFSHGVHIAARGQAQASAARSPAPAIAFAG
jgi:hypothetical protein